jgi:hypothetical protein
LKNDGFIYHDVFAAREGHTVSRLEEIGSPRRSSIFASRYNIAIFISSK